EPLSAEIFYDSLKTLEKKGNTVSDPVTGSFSIIVPFGERYAFHGKKEGYLPVHMNLDLRVADNVYKEVNVEIKLPELRKGKEIAINNLFFETNKHDITRESEPELDSLANVLKENKNIRVLIEGHTDNVGKDSDNLTLSLARAKAVSEYLIVRHKVEKDRLETKGFGKTRPLVDNNSDDNRHKNRRVMFQILE
ncbi:MAG: OmpA family protein, partial [Leptospira sp.]|nr:OmpA family protein [Leptospira sp.]